MRHQNQGQVCSSCAEGEAFSRGICSSCYSKLRASGSVPGQRRCGEEGCGNGVKARGLCNTHYSRLRTTVGLPGKPECAFPGCEKVSYTKGLCSGHRAQVLRGKSPAPLQVKSPGTWRKWVTNGQGYVTRTRWNPETGKQEHEQQHRLVVEQRIGRKLQKGENVHHLNGDRSDNRSENLELWEVSQMAGQRVSDKIREAHRVLGRYGGDPAKYE